MADHGPGGSSSLPPVRTLLLIGLGLVVGGIATGLFSAVPLLQAQSSSPLTIQPDTGRVGIGTTNPQAKLDVVGTIAAEAITGPGIWTYVGSTKLAVNGNSIIFSGIPAKNYIRIMYKLAGSPPGAEEVRIRFNGDTAANYAFTFVYGNGTGAASTGLSSATYGRLAAIAFDNTFWTLGEALITNVDSEKKTLTTFMSGHHPGTWSETTVGSTVWNNTTSRITSFTLFTPNNANFKSGSEVKVWSMD